MSVNPSELLQLARHQIAADKKKSAVLALLLFVLLVVLVRMFAGGSAPEQVKANSVAIKPVGTKPAGASMRPIPRDARTNPTPPKTGPTAANTASIPEYEFVGIEDDLPRVLARDIFSTPDWSLFPEDSEPVGSEGALGFQAGRLWDRLTESMDSIKHQQLDDFEAQIGALKLHATVTGARPVAYISGRIVREGDVIDGFSVVRINERQVTLRKFGHTGSIELP